MTANGSVTWKQVVDLWHGLAVERIEVRQHDAVRHTHPAQGWDFKDTSKHPNLYMGPPEETAAYIVNGGEGLTDDEYAHLMLAAHNRRSRSLATLLIWEVFTDEAQSKLRGGSFWHTNAVNVLPGNFPPAKRVETWEMYVADAAATADQVAGEYVVVRLPTEEFNRVRIGPNRGMRTG